MSDDQESTKKSGWGQLGHQWITAIAALVTALAGAGFFLGRTSAPDAEQSKATTVSSTETVTVTATPEVRPVGEAPTTAPQPKTDGAVYWTGELTWGKFNLDHNPPNYTDGEYLARISSDSLYVKGNTIVTSWKKSGRPGKGECASAVDTDGSNQVQVTTGNQVCGRTAEGRIFVLDVVGAGNTIRTKVTVWNK
ncbi:hypothetical protein DMH03_06480 [Amycolatopsis sp. WAC 01376]|uniref:hypothetical protein n=1 Tax=Amycolatopsis sp. WAC 01376 TaxID=2203195 RepID=UPI000F775D16|nr:hypothetical protein [Amycolatopsis sp. WAC 01376]RSM66738.1 hypothetical protein DMH03_06480 [Amycolatopsis sp. WAC 01376]